MWFLGAGVQEWVYGVKCKGEGTLANDDISRQSEHGKAKSHAGCQISQSEKELTCMLQAEEIRGKSGESSETATQAHRQHQIHFLGERGVAFAQANQYAQHKAANHIDRQCSPGHTQPMDRLAS